MVEKGEIVGVAGWGSELWVVTEETLHEFHGELDVQVARMEQTTEDSSLFDRIAKRGGEDRHHVEGYVEISRLMRPLPGFEEVLASGPDVKPILDELRAKRRVTSAP
jgi:hypothetical protein